MERDFKISAGSYDLNIFLHGGYERDIITMIAGPAGSGKTTFCQMAAVSQAKKEYAVFYMDTEGGFSIERVKQILGTDSKHLLDKVLERILLFKPTSFEEQIKYFEKLSSAARKKKERLGVVIVDGMTMLYRLALADIKGEQGISSAKNINRELARQMQMLAEIARREHIPVLVTNQVYHDFIPYKELEKGKKREVHFVGGDLLKYWSKCILELDYERGRRTAILRKHRSLPEKKLSFKIVQEGVKKLGWL
jgi:DNA repair protein RadB